MRKTFLQPKFLLSLLTLLLIINVSLIFFLFPITGDHFVIKNESKTFSITKNNLYQFELALKNANFWESSYKTQETSTIVKPTEILIVTTDKPQPFSTESVESVGDLQSKSKEYITSSAKYRMDGVIELTFQIKPIAFEELKPEEIQNTILEHIRLTITDIMYRSKKPPKRYNEIIYSIKIGKQNDYPFKITNLQK